MNNVTINEQMKNDWILSCYEEEEQLRLDSY